MLTYVELAQAVVERAEDLLADIEDDRNDGADVPQEIARVQSALDDLKAAWRRERL